MPKERQKNTEKKNFKLYFFCFICQKKLDLTNFKVNFT